MQKNIQNVLASAAQIETFFYSSPTPKGPCLLFRPSTRFQIKLRYAHEWNRAIRLEGRISYAMCASLGAMRLFFVAYLGKRYVELL